MRANNGFVTQQHKKYRKRLPIVGELDPKKITFGNKTKYQSAPGNFVPVFYESKPLSFQVRGAFITFAGTSQKADNLKVPVLQRSYALLIDGVKNQCPYLPGSKGDGASLYKFQRTFEDIIETKVQDIETAKKWGCTFKQRNRETRQMEDVPSRFVPAISEGVDKRDANGNPTGEVYNPSIRFPLRIACDKNRNPLDEFTTKFKDEYGNKLDIRPSNINDVVSYGTFAIMHLSYGRMWVGDGKFKVTVYVNETTLLLPRKTTYETDSFVTEPEGQDDAADSPEQTPVQTPTQAPTEAHKVADKEIDKELDQIIDDDFDENELGL